MKICIPIESNDGKKSKICAHFGSAPFFIIYDAKKNMFETLENSNSHHTHGTCNPVGIIADKDIDAVVCRGMGLRAINRLNESGIKVFRSRAARFGDFLKEYEEGILEELDIKQSCSDHNCH